MKPRARAAALTFAAALGVTGTARAQARREAPQVPTEAAPATAPTPAPSPAPPPTPESSEAAPEAPPAPPPSEAERLDDIEQLVRISARKHELLEEEAAKRKKEAPVLVIDDKGFALKTPDNDFVLKIRGLLQADARYFINDDALNTSDTFLIRKFRPSFDGTLFGLVDFRLLAEFAGTPTILDAYADLRPWPWLRFRAGKFKSPVGLERLQADADVPLVERALDQNLSNQRDIGGIIWGDVGTGIFNYVVGVVNGAPDTTAADTDINHAKDFVGRVFFQPFNAPALRELGNLGVGFAAATGNRKGRLPTAVSGSPIPTAAAQTGLAGFRTSGQNTFFTYFAPATDTTGATTTFAHERATRINPQLYYYYDNIGLLSEFIYVWQGVQRGNNTTTLNQKAAHATVTYSFNGRESFEGTTPVQVFDRKQGTWGALQLAFRWSWLKVDAESLSDPNVNGTGYADATRSAASATAYAGGVAWIPRRSYKILLDFEQTRFEGGAGRGPLAATPGIPAMPALIVDRKTENALFGRVQVNF